jgi:serine/threonine-protein kinase
VKIADFGIAKADDQTELTRDGSLIGTASYLAPEQLTGSDVDGRADLYALALVMYECLTGRVPFEGDTGAAVALARLHTTPVDPRRLRSDVPPRLADALMRALERDPDDRFSSAADFRAALLRTEVNVPAPQPGPPPPEPAATAAPEPQSFGRSERRWLLPAFVILLIAVAIIVAGLLLRESASTSTSDPGTTTTVAAAGPLPIASMSSFDPQGSGATGENDAMAGRAADGDDRSAWRTETYDQSDFFGDKTGVGLVVELGQRSALESIRVAGSTNGWSGQVFVLDGPPGPDSLDGATPAGTVTDVRGQVSVDLGGATGSTVVVWITDLGEPGEGSRHRVEVQEVVAIGVPVG